jgi:signal transduction histidine kinase/DNA-binding response OmpR family regulator
MSRRLFDSSHSILVVDDEPGIRELLAWELGEQGYEVVAAADGAEALEHVRRTEFDLIISDIRMPRVGGLDLLRSAKEIAPDTEVVIATGYAELEYAIECVRHGAFDFVQKPFHIEDLLATVSRALERRCLRRTAGLYEASRTILGTQETHRLPELITRLAMQAMNADDASLMLPDADGRLYIAHSHSLSPEVQAEVHQVMCERVAGRVAAVGEPALIPNGLAGDPRFADLTSMGRVRSSIVYPLLAGKRLVGVLSINRLSGRPFRAPDLERAAILASQVMLALENARLVRQVASSEKLASVGLLATGVAHEINNPAACVLASYSYLENQMSGLDRLGSLLDSGADARAVRRAWEALGGAAFVGGLREVLGDLGAGASRIRDIVRDIRSLARRDESKPAMFDLNEAIRSALRMTGAELRHRATVETQLGEDLKILGSPGRLSQVFVNLLVNAAQALAELNDGRQHQIAIRSERVGGRVVASVKDDGPGIRPEHLSRVFETFYTTKGATVGTGLGLSISREIVQDHGGELRVESSLGQGATFIVTLPFADTAATESPGCDGPPARQGAPGAARDTRFRILFVDDERSLLRAYERTFGNEHEVVVADGGEQALAILAGRWDFNLVVCDLLMPNVSGMEVYRRATEAHPELGGAFVFTTGGVTQADVQTFLRTVGNPVLEKPFDFSELREILESERDNRGSDRSSVSAMRTTDDRRRRRR